MDWTNDETYMIGLWLGNTEPLPNVDSASALRELVEDDINASFNNILQSDCIASDLLKSSLQRVNWQELFEYIHEDEEDEDDSSS